MRALIAVFLALGSPSADAAPSRLERLSQETSDLVVEINALDRSLQLHLTSFARQGRSAAASTKESRALEARAAALLKRWDAPSPEWNALPEERREQFKSMRGWLADLRAAVLQNRVNARIAFEEAAAVCDLPRIAAGISTLCSPGCDSGALMSGYGAPCALRERKTVLLMPINQEKLKGGKHRVGVEGGALALQPHGRDALRAPLARYWAAVFALPLESVAAEEIEVLRRYPAHIAEDAPERATGAEAVERARSVWALHAHNNPASLEAEAEEAARRAYLEMIDEAAAVEAASSASGIRSEASARDAIRRVLRAAGSARGVSDQDAQSLLAANRSAEAPEDWPAHSLRETVAGLLGSADAVRVAGDGTIVFSAAKSPLRVVADPANRSFRVCRDACGERDFLTVDGRPPAAMKDAKKPKKKRRWFGGSDDEGDDAPALPTRFLIKELLE